MASVGGGADNIQIEGNGSGKYGPALTLMVSLFFMIGFITVFNDVLIPAMKEIFHFGPKDNGKLMMIQFCFFIGYGVMSIPAGIIVNKVGYKKGLMLALGIIALGLFLFVPAANVKSYGFFLFALAVVAMGLAVLQVVINPFIIALGSPETGASRLNLGGGLNSTATFIGPILGGFLILSGIPETAEKKAADNTIETITEKLSDDERDVLIKRFDEVLSFSGKDSTTRVATLTDASALTIEDPKLKDDERKEAITNLKAAAGVN